MFDKITNFFSRQVRETIGDLFNRNYYKTFNLVLFGSQFKKKKKRPKAKNQPTPNLVQRIGLQVGLKQEEVY